MTRLSRSMYMLCKVEYLKPTTSNVPSFLKAAVTKNVVEDFTAGVLATAAVSTSDGGTLRTLCVQD